MTISIDPLVAAITAIMAGGLIWLGWSQIRALGRQIQRLKESSARDEKSSRGELILRLNTIYGGMIDARRDAMDLHKECERKYPSKSSRSRSAFADELKRLRNSQEEVDTKRYYRLRELLDFGELVGFLVVERKILTSDDIEGLWGTALKTWADWFEDHITDLQRDYDDAYILLLQLVKKL